MRMTNEEFMAEVMQRSHTYRVRRKKQIIGTVTTLCLCAVVGIGAFAFYAGKKSQNALKEKTAYEDAVSAAPPAENNNPACDAVPRKGDEPTNHANAIANEKDGDTSSRAPESSQAIESSAAPAESSSADHSDEKETNSSQVIPEHQVYVLKPDEELFSYYGIYGIEQRLKIMSYDANYNVTAERVFTLSTDSNLVPVHGITYTDESESDVESDANTWVYVCEETGETIYVTLWIKGNNPNAPIRKVPDDCRVITRMPVRGGTTLQFMVEGDFPQEPDLIGRFSSKLHILWT